MIEKRCERCDQGFQARRRSQKYCGKACRQAAYRARRVAEDESAVAVFGFPVSRKRKPKSQLAHDIETAKAYVAWRRANHEEREL